MFHEIKRPIKVLKEQVFKRVNIFSSSKRMMSENKASLEEERKQPPVAKDVTKSEFKKRYRGLFIHSSIVLFVFIYTLLFLVTSQNLIALIVSSVITIFFVTNYVFSIYRAWIARFYYRNWDERFTQRVFKIGDFFDAVSSRPILILPVFDINKEY